MTTYTCAELGVCKAASPACAGCTLHAARCALRLPQPHYSGWALLPKAEHAAPPSPPVAPPATRYVALPDRAKRVVAGKVTGHVQRAVLWQLMEAGTLGMAELGALVDCSSRVLYTATLSLRHRQLVAYAQPLPDQDGRQRWLGLTKSGIDAALKIKPKKLEGNKPDFKCERKRVKNGK